MLDALGLSFLTQEPLFSTYIMPLLICLARVVDVSMGTVRSLLANKGHKKVAPIIGFFEVTIWVSAMGVVVQNLGHWQNLFAYGLGYALGNFLGIYIEERIALGNSVVRIITNDKAHDLAKILVEKGFRVSLVNAQGNNGKVNIIFLLVKRKTLKSLIPLIKKHNPLAVYSVEDIRYADLKLEKLEKGGITFPLNILKNIK